VVRAGGTSPVPPDPLHRSASRTGATRRFESSRAYLADVAHEEEHRVASSERPVRAGSSASQVRGVTGSTTSSNLVGPGSNPGGPAVSRAGAIRLSHGKSGNSRVVSTPQSDRAPRPRLRPAAGRNRIRLSTPNRQDAGSNPARSFSRSGSSVDRAVPDCDSTTAAVSRPSGCGPERSGYR
jgi:hypothetical protein